MILRQQGYVAIRKDSSTGKLWIDISSFDLLLAETEHKVRDMNNSIPSWGDANPVEYIAKAELVELEKVKR